MWHAHSIQDVVGQARLGRRVGLLIIAALGLPVAGIAQQAVDPRATFTGTQDGRLLDANPSLNSGRYNLNTGLYRPGSPLLSGNLAASGLLGRGMSLRIDSPVSSTTGFRAGLGSGSLSSFRRDSVSVADAAAPLGISTFIRPFLDPATTVVNPGLLQGQFTPGLTRSSGSTAQPLDLRIPFTEAQWLSNPAYLEPADPRRAGVPGITAPASRLPSPTTSGIFGTPTVPDLPRRRDPLAPWGIEPPDETTDTREPPPLPDQRMDVRPADRTRPIATFPQPSDSPLERLLGQESQTGIGLRSPVLDTPPWAAGAQRPGLVPPPPEDAGGEEPAAPARLTDPSVLPGFDVFTDMRLALALEKNPGATWFDEMRKAARSQPELDPSPTERAAEDATVFLDQMLNTPLRTFRGHGASALNEMMLKAEALIAIGHYREAADRYEAARFIAPDNPLPMVGKAHALLAAGSYSQAASALLEAIERFPEIARFKFDLSTLMGGGEQVDIRRADIMRRLRQAEWPELYFLLGYLEYHSGDRERGMANLEKAAELDQMRTMISRFPALLRGEGVLPVPKIDLESGTTPSPSPRDPAMRK
jgi:hypothetical protein